MPKKSILEDIAGNSLKHPILGASTSFIFLCVGFYFTFSHSPSGSVGALSNGIYKLFSYFCFGLSVFATIFTVIGYVKNKNNTEKRHEFFESKKTLLSLKQMSWKEFEHFVGTFFEKQGYSVEVTGGLRDGGIDLIVTKDRRTYFVQCKKYRQNQVTLSMMRDFYGAISSQANNNLGFFVTTGTFTLDARKFAEKNAIEAIDGSRLIEYLKSEDIPTVAAAGLSGLVSFASSTSNGDGRFCPNCGSPMVVRVAKKGTHVKEPFWGCSTYPKCKAIVAFHNE